MKEQNCHVVLAAPEDLGSTLRVELFSWWQTAELFDLQQEGLQRYATLGCELSSDCGSPSPLAWLRRFEMDIPCQSEGWCAFTRGKLPFMYAGPLSRKCNCAREHNPKANLCLSGQALPEFLWHQLKDKLQRHHGWMGKQEGSSVLDSNWCGKP